MVSTQWRWNGHWRNPSLHWSGIWAVAFFCILEWHRFRVCAADVSFDLETSRHIHSSLVSGTQYERESHPARNDTFPLAVFDAFHRDWPGHAWSLLELPGGPHGAANPRCSMRSLHRHWLYWLAQAFLHVRSQRRSHRGQTLA